MTESTTSATDEDELDAPDEAVEDAPDDPPESTDGEDSTPSLEDDEMADLDAIAEDVAAADAENDESEDAEDPSEDESGSETSDDSTSTTSRSWGKMYTKGVVKASEAIVTEFGDESSEPITEADVRDLELDEAFDEWMVEKTGRPEDIPPGQWVAIGTMMLLGGNALTETDALEGALDGAL